MFTLFSKRHSRLLAMIEFVRSVTLALWGPRAIVEVYGSYTTCLSVPSSDLDLVVLLREDDARAEAAASAQMLPHMHGRPLHPSAGPLQRVTAELKRRGGLEWIRAILTTKVPVLKFSTVRERIPTDVSVAIVPSFPSHSLPAHSGIMARELVRDLILVHADLAPVTLVLKQFLVEAGLNDPYRGGLGSYCLVLMVACWLDTSRTEDTAGRAGGAWASPMSPQLAARTSGSTAVGAGRRGRSNSNPDRSSSPNSSLAQALLGFLTYMGTTFDPRLTGVRWDLAEGRGHFFPLPPLKPGGLRADGTIPPPLVLLDPFNPASNVGSSVFNWHLVQGAFRSALEALVAPDTEFPNMSLLSRIVSLGA
jgi:non-canonical poly(A) RNA polymerase PAPD5/7